MADTSATDSLKPGTAIVVLNIIAKNGYMTGYTFHNVTGKAWADVLDILDKPEFKPYENGVSGEQHQSRVEKTGEVNGIIEGDIKEIYELGSGSSVDTNESPVWP